MRRVKIRRAREQDESLEARECKRALLEVYETIAPCVNGWGRV